MKLPIIVSLAMLAPALPAVFALPAPAHAQQAEKQAENQSPEQAVRATIERVMAAIRSDPGGRAGDPERIYQLVRQHFLPATDFGLTTQYAVGEAWASATPAQREALVSQFTTLLARTFALQLTQIHAQDTRFTYAPAARPAAGASDAVVKTSVRTEGDLMPIDYRLRKTGDGWKIYDINMMGAWMIQVYRRQFAARLASGGIDGLIKYLAAHNAAV
ncbi:MlaC/ttg2D family ABC transporter substrate-binding protein [Massilia sp. GCM10023247]|uniref:MlaC/ttg2D family ABC transporter substrate-binding protein n=1 Tax=Massilia sp. GCM10023247 TaxID=3252643 RepID=UPI00360E93A8